MVIWNFNSKILSAFLALLTKLDYYVFLKNNDNDEVIVIFDNDLDSLKSMAEKALFNEN